MRGFHCANALESTKMDLNVLKQSHESLNSTTSFHGSQMSHDVCFGITAYSMWFLFVQIKIFHPILDGKLSKKNKH